MTVAKPSMSIVPPLENGDSPKETLRERLTRTEFERRYQAMPHIPKAELIEGVTYMASPLRIRSHGEPHGLVVTGLGTYKAFTPGVILGIEPTVRLDPDNEPQPDAIVMIPGAQARIDAEDYISGGSKFRLAGDRSIFTIESGRIVAMGYENISSGER